MSSTKRSKTHDGNFINTHFETQQDASWDHFLKTQYSSPYWNILETRLKEEQVKYHIVPESERILEVFKEDKYPFSKLSVIIIGQDPYHTPGVANGMAFSVHGDYIPPSLKNIFKEIVDSGCEKSENLESGNLESWAKQGVFLLNKSFSILG